MFWTVTLSLLEGFLMTMRLFVMTLAFALPLGLIIAFGSMSRWRPLKALSRFSRFRWCANFRPIKLLVDAVVWVIRGTPLMLQLVVIYYGPGLILDNNWWGSGSTGRFIAVLVAFVINYACYFSVIYRGGIEAIPKGQYEAGEVLGMTKSQIFFRVVLLQVIKRIVPPMSNEIITLVKDTSLARIIACYEIIWNAQAYIKSAGLIWPLFYTAVFYLLFSGLLTLIFGWIERKMDYFRV